MPDVKDPPDGQPSSLPGGAANPPAPAGAQSALAGAQVAPAAPLPGPTAEQLALEAGWTMAVLYGTMKPAGSGLLSGVLPGLPTANELPAADRRKLELNRLEHLLQRLAAMPGFAGSHLPAEVPAPDAGEADLEALNFKILCALAATRQQTLLAYELGRSLRDTASPPEQRGAAGRAGQRDATGPLEQRGAASPPDPRGAASPPVQPEERGPWSAFLRQFARDRIATMQGWLATLSSELQPQAVAVVAASLGRWADFVAVTASAHAGPSKTGDATKVAKTTGTYLLRQGDLWLMLLTGTRSTSGLLSPEGYVAAGELALRRSGTIVRGILRHYWPALVIGAAALGAILYLAATYMGGAAKVWTYIAAIAGSLGITARAIASTTTRLAAEAAHPVFNAAEEDVMAWAITTMPPLRLSARQVRQLRQAGIAPTSKLGRV